MKVSILGAGGLTGKEIIGFLAKHPHFELVHITSDKFAGKKLESIFPNIPSKFKNLSFNKHSDVIPEKSLVVLAVPDEVSLKVTPELLEKGYKVIDISGVYRIHSKEEFENYYNLKHDSFFLMEKVVYGLPEMNRSKIINSNFVSNPGCYATSTILPIFMLGNLRQKISQNIVISSASGVSGAGGRKEEIAYSFTSLHDNFKSYRVLNHQHTPEINEYSSYNMQTNLPKIIFTPHLLPVYRGILSTIVVHFNQKINYEDIKNEYNNYSEEKFIRFYNSTDEISLHNVQNTNYLDIAFKTDGNTLVVVSALDNLVKGAGGQAIQNMNLMAGYPETMGLE
jgi:N-acetyl-gamma-glutamyl-phosphate reductase